MKIDMEHDAETLRNDLAKVKVPSFGDQTLEANDTLITGEEPTMHFFLF